MRIKYPTHSSKLLHTLGAKAISRGRGTSVRLGSNPMISDAWRIYEESHYLFEGEQLHIVLVLSSQTQSSLCPVFQPFLASSLHLILTSPTILYTYLPRTHKAIHPYNHSIFSSASASSHLPTPSNRHRKIPHRHHRQTNIQTRPHSHRRRQHRKRRARYKRWRATTPQFTWMPARKRRRFKQVTALTPLYQLTNNDKRSGVFQSEENPSLVT